MDPINTQWIIGGITLALGLIIGFLIGRTGKDGGQQEALLEQLHNAHKDLEDYKREVSAHFDQTAQLVNNLTESYKEVHLHLANGAQHLGAQIKSSAQLHSPEEALGLTKPPVAEQPGATDGAEEDAPRPPKDYAPKRDPQETGTLSESYGLKAEPAEEEAKGNLEAQSARQAV